MALIAMFSYLFSSFVVYQAVAEKNLTVITEENINSKCKGIAGFKSVDIIWQPLGHKDFSNLTIYRVLYCTSGPPCDGATTGQYQLGCTVNTSHSLQKELQCSIIAKDLFPFAFYFKVEIITSAGAHFISKRKSCRLITHTRCTIPQNLTVTATRKKTLSVSWKPPLFMGQQLTPLLCYKIWYAAAEAKNNESMEILSNGESQLFQTISDLYPYTEYTLFIQCGFADCYGGWGLFGGPVTVRTNEEAPAKAPEFRNWSSSNIAPDKRDVTVLWKLPPSNTWNGVPNGFNINFWQLSLGENDSSTPLRNSSRYLRIDDGFATKATLPGLSRFADYKTQISMCTAEGCGPWSVPLPFAGEKNPNISPIHDPSDDNVLTWFVIGIVSGLIIFVGVVVGVVVAWRYRKNKQSRRQQLSLQQRIQLRDPLYGNQEDSSSSRSHSYDEIPLQPGEDLRDALHRNQGNGDLDNSRQC